MCVCVCWYAGILVYWYVTGFIVIQYRGFSPLNVKMLRGCLRNDRTTDQIYICRAVWSRNTGCVCVCVCVFVRTLIHPSGNRALSMSKNLSIYINIYLSIQ